jgi:type II secretory pathway predicted ATPase ExeA
MSDSAWRYFKLKRDPFGSLPDPALFYTTRARREPYNALLRAIDAEGGLFVLMGEAGIGKTALLRRLEAELRSAGYQVISERRAGLSFNDLISILSHLTCISEAADDFDQWLARFHEVSAARAKAQSPLVLLIEEADGLGAEAASRLDRLLSLQHGQPGGLRVVLGGQVSLRLLARLEAKVRFTFLTRLDDSEIGGFIYHRLRCSGCRDPDFFSLGAIDEVARRTGGLPRQINILCAGALRLASADACSVISAEHVEMAARQLLPPAATASVRESAQTPILRRVGLLVGPAAAAASIAAGIIVGVPIYFSGGREGGAGKEQFASAVVEAATPQVRAEAPAIETGAGSKRVGISAPLLDGTRPDIEIIRPQLVDDRPNPEETLPAGAINIEIARAAIARQFAAIDASLSPNSSAANAPPTEGAQEASGIAKVESSGREGRDETTDGTLVAASDETPRQSTTVAALVARAAIQLAGNRISDPAGDNALATYRQISNLAPENPETHRLREQICDAL